MNKVALRTMVVLAALTIPPAAFPIRGHTAFVQSNGKAPSSKEEKEIYNVYQTTQKADSLLAEGKYAQAEPILSDGLKTLQSTIKRYPNVRYYAIPVRPAELQFARALDLPFSEFDNPGATQIVATRYEELLEQLLSQALQVQGKDPNWTDELILDRAVGAIRQIDPPVPDADAPTLETRLRLAVTKVEAVLARSPKLKKEGLYNTTGEQALADGRAKLAKITEQAKEARVSIAATPPDSVQTSLQVFNQNCDQIQNQITSREGFVEDGSFERYIIASQKLLQQEEQSYRQSYEQAGKIMPADALEPVKQRLAALKALAEQNASRHKWPATTVQDPAIQQRVKSQLVRNIPGVKVLKLGMKDRAWTINKNDFGVPESRYKSGYILYQMPGEKFARCSIFNYREDYAGGGQFTPGDGASSYAGTRWQKVAP